MKATETLVTHEIIPRWQTFINEENKDELAFFQKKPFGVLTNAGNRCIICAKKAMASLNIGFKGVFSFDFLLKGNGVFRILRRPRCPFLFGYQLKALIQKDPDEEKKKKKKNKRKRKRK